MLSSCLTDTAAASNAVGYGINGSPAAAKLGILAATLALLVTVLKIHAVGLVIGLSVVVLNLLCFTVQRAFK